MSSHDPLIDDLIAVVGADHVLVEPDQRAPYESDWRGRYSGSACAVVRPGNCEELSAVVACCAGRSVAMVPQGGNTGLCGAATPRGGEVLIAMGRMNRIRALDPINDTITVEAGCTLADLQVAADERDRLFPLSLASEGSCQIGGNISTNAGGVHVLRYGNTRDLVLGIEAVLPDGRIWHGLRGLRKDNTGYDLKQLFIGGEGTLGIVTAAVLKLLPKPQGSALAWVAVPSPVQALALLAEMHARCPSELNAFELIGREALEMVVSHIPGARDPLDVSHEWYVLAELAGVEPDSVLTERLEVMLADAIESRLVQDAAVARSEAQKHALWALRENISEAQRLEGLSIKHDIAVPVSRVPEFLARAGARLAADFPEMRVVAFGHLGDGNLHYNLSAEDPGVNETFIERTPMANRIVHDLVHEFEGSISAEHGLGQLKREEILRYRDPVETALMKQIKHALDPKGLMNPGKLL